MIISIDEWPTRMSFLRVLVMDVQHGELVSPHETAVYKAMGVVRSVCPEEDREILEDSLNMASPVTRKKYWS